MTEETSRKHKHFAKVSSEILRQFMQRHNYTMQQMADALGYSYTAMLTYHNGKEMPKVVGVAVEGLARRLGPNARDMLFMVTVAPDKAELFIQTAKLVGAKVVEVPLGDSSKS